MKDPCIRTTDLFICAGDYESGVSQKFYLKFVFSLFFDLPHFRAIQSIN